MTTCCYCKKAIPGKVTYAIPEDFPINPMHEGKPLCDECGERPEPSLDEICHQLDVEFRSEVERQVREALDNKFDGLGLYNAFASIPPLVQKVILKLLADATESFAIHEARMKKMTEGEMRAPDGTVTTIPISVGDVTKLQVEFTKHEASHIQISDDREESTVLTSATLDPNERRLLIVALGGKP